MRGFRVTYEIVTPESAEHGDAAERGFIEPDGFRLALMAGATAMPDAMEMTLRQAQRLISVGALEDSGSWFSECDGRQNYATGAEERRSLHPPRNITGASYARLARLFGLADESIYKGESK